MTILMNNSYEVRYQLHNWPCTVRVDKLRLSREIKSSPIPFQAHSPPPPGHIQQSLLKSPGSGVNYLGWNSSTYRL